MWNSENQNNSYDHKRTVKIITVSYDHISSVTIMLLRLFCAVHCNGAVTIILSENKMPISLILHVYQVFCLVPNDDKLHIYNECKLCVYPWRPTVTIEPCPNSPSPTCAILYDRNCYDRNCFPTVVLTLDKYIFNWWSERDVATLDETVTDRLHF